MDSNTFKQAFSGLLNGILFLIAFNLYAQQNALSVGDIAFDAKTDDPKFQFCNPNFVLQEYELKTSSDESYVWISNELRQNFIHQASWSDQTGFVTVRFAVNCFGLTDRFRVRGVDSNLEAVDFSPKLTQHLIKLLKEIKWPVKTYQMKSVDYYQDVTFKLVNGELRETVL